VIGVAGLPFIVVLTDNTSGGVTASFAIDMLINRLELRETLVRVKDLLMG